jgi:hypothetical protein
MKNEIITKFNISLNIKTKMSFPTFPEDSLVPLSNYINVLLYISQKKLNNIENIKNEIVEKGFACFNVLYDIENTNVFQLKYYVLEPLLNEWSTYLNFYNFNINDYFIYCNENKRYYINVYFYFPVRNEPAPKQNFDILTNYGEICTAVYRDEKYTIMNVTYNNDTILEKINGKNAIMFVLLNNKSNKKRKLKK